MKADEKKVLVKKVNIAINGVKSGSPLKDFLDEEDIYFALELLLVTHKALEILKKA